MSSFCVHHRVLQNQHHVRTANKTEAKEAMKTSGNQVYSAPEASGDKSLGTLSALRQSSCVYTEYLGLHSEDENIVQDLYKNSQIVDILCSATDAESQLQAAEYLRQLSLDEASQNQLGSKWTTVWASEKNGNGS